MIDSTIAFYKRHKEKINFSFGFAGILGIIFSIYTYKHPLEQKPALTFHVSEAFNAVTLKKSLDGLNIYFKGKDLQKEKLVLTVYKIKLSNDGKGDITLPMYGDTAFGLSLKKGDGIFIGVNITGDTNGYIQKELKPYLKDSATVLFKPVIIESKKSADMELVVIHKESITQLHFTPHGKIAGMDNILLTTDDSDHLFSLTDLWAILLIIASVSGVAFVIYGIIMLLQTLRRMIRRWMILRRYHYRLKNLSEEKLALVIIYSHLGKKKFKQVLKILLDIEQREKYFKEETIEENAVLKANELRKIKKVDLAADIKYKSIFLSSIKTLIEKDFAIESNGNIVITPNFLSEAESTLKLFL